MGLGGGGVGDDLDGFVGERDYLAVDFEGLGDGEGGGIFRAADEGGIIDAEHTGFAFSAEPVGLADGSAGRKRSGEIARCGLSGSQWNGGLLLILFAGVNCADPCNGRRSGGDGGSFVKRESFARYYFSVGDSGFDGETEAFGDDVVELLAFFVDEAAGGECGGAFFDFEKGVDASGGILWIEGGDGGVGENADFRAAPRNAGPGGVDAIDDIVGGGCAIEQLEEFRSCPPTPPTAAATDTSTS